VNGPGVFPAGAVRRAQHWKERLRAVSRYVGGRLPTRQVEGGDQPGGRIPAALDTDGLPGCGKLLGMDLPSNPPVSPAVRITVLLRLASEGFQDAFGARPEWLEAPPVDLAELREVVGVERIGQLREATGLREGEGYAAGGPPGVVRLAAAAHEGVLGLLGVAALPPEVIIEQTAEGPRYHVPEDWFLTIPAGEPRNN
jgi:hypothetical protein